MKRHKLELSREEALHYRLQRTRTTEVVSYQDNDPTKSRFASLTQQIQSFGRIPSIHALAAGQARINGDFKCHNKTGTDNGAYFKLSDTEQQSFLTYALYSAPAVRVQEKAHLSNQ